MTEDKLPMPESRFPMSFDACPMCGSKDTITKTAWAEEADKGRVKLDTPVAVQRLQVPLMDPGNTPLLIGGATGILFVILDICSDCGCLYCTAASVQDGQLHAGPPPGQGPRTSFSNS